VLPLTDQGDYRVQDLFVFTQTQSGRDEKVQGYLSPTGVLPTFHSKLVADGYDYLTEEFFQPETYGYAPPKYFAGARPKPKGGLSPQDTRPGVELEGYDV